MFDPTLGRWLTDDPIGFDGGDTDLYQFVDNSPIDSTDPSGLWIQAAFSTYSRGWYSAPSLDKQIETTRHRVTLDYDIEKDYISFRVRWMYGHSPGSLPNLFAIGNHKLHIISDDIPNRSEISDIPLKTRSLVNRNASSPLLLGSGFIIAVVPLGNVPNCVDKDYSGTIGVFTNGSTDYTEAKSIQIIRWSFNVKNGGITNSKITLEETGIGREGKIPWAGKVLRLLDSSSIPPSNWQQPFPYRKPGE